MRGNTYPKGARVRDRGSHSICWLSTKSRFIWKSRKNAPRFAPLRPALRAQPTDTLGCAVRQPDSACVRACVCARERGREQRLCVCMCVLEAVENEDRTRPEQSMYEDLIWFVNSKTDRLFHPSLYIFFKHSVCSVRQLLEQPPLMLKEWTHGCKNTFYGLFCAG